jgi:hypothetical protein
MAYVLGVDKDHFYLTDSTKGWDNRQKLYSKEELVEALSKIPIDHPFMTSSTVDFPEESTEEQWILDVCKDFG